MIGNHDSKLSIQLGTIQTNLYSSNFLKPSVLILKTVPEPTWTSVGAISDSSAYVD